MKGSSNRTHMDGLRHRADANAGFPLPELSRNRIVACRGEFAVAAMRRSGEGRTIAPVPRAVSRHGAKESRRRVAPGQKHAVLFHNIGADLANGGILIAGAAAA